VKVLASALKKVDIKVGRKSYTRTLGYMVGPRTVPHTTDVSEEADGICFRTGAMGAGGTTQENTKKGHQIQNKAGDTRGVRRGALGS